MDLLDLTQHEAVKFEVQHPDGISGTIKDEKGKEFFVELYGKHTVKYKRAYADLLGQMAELAKDKKDDDSIDVELSQSDAVSDFLAKITKSHYLISGGKKVADKDLADTYKSVSWLRDFADTKSSNAASYIEKKSKS